MESHARPDRRRDRCRAIAIRIWRTWVKPILTVVLVLGSIKTTVADWYDVPTGSMKPTILEGDRIAVNKLAYDLKLPLVGWQLINWSDPGRGDVVVCISPEDGIRLVKRVIGLPGDRIEMRDNRLIVNGQPAIYSPLDADVVAWIPDTEQPQHVFAAEDLGEKTHAVMATPAVPAPRSISPTVIPEGRYLVLGDNRDQSKDSRYFGFVPRDQILGRAFGVAFSLDRDHWYVPRWHRFLYGLN